MEADVKISRQDREDAAQLLGTLVQSIGANMSTYSASILRVLLPDDMQNVQNVSSNAIRCIGKVAEIGECAALQKDFATIFQVGLAALNIKGTDIKRKRALKTLCSLVCNTGNVVKPYEDNPNLMSTLIMILRFDQRPDVRRETIRLIGILGAIDPYKLSQIEDRGLPSEEELTTINDSVDATNAEFKADEAVLSQLRPHTSGDYYETAALTYLLAIISDDTLELQHRLAIDSIMRAFRVLGLQCLPFLPKILAALQRLVKAGSTNSRDRYLSHLTELISLSSVHIRPFVGTLFDLIKANWDSSPSAVLDILLAISRILPTDFRLHVIAILPSLAAASVSDVSKMEIRIRILDAFSKFALTQPSLCMIVPALCSAIELVGPAAIPLQHAALKSLSRLVSNLDLAAYFSRLIHPLVRLLPRTEEKLAKAIIDTICLLMANVGPSSLIFLPLVRKAIVKSGRSHSVFSTLTDKMRSGERIDDEKSRLQSGLNIQQITSQPMPHAPELKFALSELELERLRAACES